MEDHLSGIKFEGPKWFILLVAFVYGSGFLIVYTHFSRLGLLDLGSFIKLKYIHIGTIYSILVIILLVPWIIFFYFLKVCNENKKRINLFGIFWGEDRIIYFWTIGCSLITIFLSLITFFSFAFYSVHGELRANPILIGFNFVPIFMIFMLRNIIDLLHNFKIVNKDDFLSRANCAFCITIFALQIMVICTIVNINVFPAMFKKLYTMVFCRYGYNFLLIIFLLGIIIYKIVDMFIAEHSVSKGFKSFATAISFSMVFILYIFSIHTFAVFFYPYIPIEKGGADYSTAPIVNLYCHREMPEKIMKKFSNNHETQSAPCIETGPVILINETNETIFVANIVEAQKSDFFRDLTYGKKVELIGINREYIRDITYRKDIRPPGVDIKP
ncbi:MAG: hypothetical protein ACOZFS_00320 [Thermodesulfobacteriota bacterium]